jgi:hypothetical protein
LSCTGGGTINNTVIGGTTPAAGSFTTLRVTATSTNAALFGTSATMNGAFIWNPNNGPNPYFGIYATNNSLIYGISASLPAPSGTSTLGGWYKGLGVGGSTSGTGAGIFGVLASGQTNSGPGNVAFTITDKNQIYSFNNTLDDGSGNVSVVAISLLPAM